MRNSCEAKPTSYKDDEAKKKNRLLLFFFPNTFCSNQIKMYVRDLLTICYSLEQKLHLVIMLHELDRRFGSC